MGQNHVVDPLQKTRSIEKIHPQSWVEHDQTFGHRQTIVDQKIYHTAG